MYTGHIGIHGGGDVRTYELMEGRTVDDVIAIKTNRWVTIFYYINTYEIPSELSRGNMTSSHVKIIVALVTYENRAFRCLS